MAIRDRLPNGPISDPGKTTGVPVPEANIVKLPQGSQLKGVAELRPLARNQIRVTQTLNHKIQRILFVRSRLAIEYDEQFYREVPPLHDFEFRVLEEIGNIYASHFNAEHGSAYNSYHRTSRERIEQYKKDKNKSLGEQYGDLFRIASLSSHPVDPDQNFIDVEFLGFIGMGLKERIQAALI